MVRPHWVGLLLVILASGLAISVGPVNAETYNLTASPDRAQEGASSGVTLSLDVRGASPGVLYQFAWMVIDPAGKNHTAARSTTPSFPNFVVSVTFPNDFSSGAIGFVGAYQVTVSQLSPTPRLNVAPGQFRAGLTESESYQRTFPVSVRAVGYKSNETVTIDISRGGVSAQGFPSSNITDSTGSFLFVWDTSPSLALGSYTVSLRGAVTPDKSPPDVQTFSMYPTNITITEFSMSDTLLFRTELSEFFFIAKYLSGVPVQDGSGSVRVIEPDGLTSHTVPATYNGARGGFEASYRTLLSGQTGVWSAMVEINSLDDGYGNAGPPSKLTSPSKFFSLQPATLTVSSYVPNATYGSGDIVGVYATVTAPGGTGFTEGSVIASFSVSGNPVGTPVSLAYDQSLGRWVGGYTVRADDPSGIWSVQLTAADPYDNRGDGSTSLLVHIQPQQSPILSLWWVFVVMAVGAGFASAVILLRRKVSSRELKIDLRVIEMEADRLKNQDFFRSVEEQLKKQESSTKPDEKRS